MLKVTSYEIEGNLKVYNENLCYSEKFSYVCINNMHASISIRQKHLRTILCIYTILSNISYL